MNLLNILCDSVIARFWRTERAGNDAIRLALCAILFTHGFYRWYEGSVPQLGAILSSVGFPQGVLLAYLVNAAEVAGTLLLALRIGVWPVCFILSFSYLTGIALFHARQGFFVVGPGSGGWEYSALLIVCLLSTAWANRDHKMW
jgi:putative oxidoreductase